jgi:hypothetical protein
VAGPLAQSRALVTGLQYLSLALLCVPSTIQAGAWTPERGRVTAIASTSLSHTPVADDAVTTDLYYERGLGKGWALIFSPSLSSHDNIFARNEAELGLRRSLYEKGPWALSTQISAFVWKERKDAEVSTGTEVRLALGRSFGDGGWVDVETGLRGCGGQNGLRFEGTLGHKVRQNDKAILKVFGDSEGCAANITRVQASYVYGLTENIGIELGWRETLPNAGNWMERGAVVGLWLKF